MKKSLKNIICLKSMFSKLIACFILIILIISSFHLITNQIYKRNMENEITENVSQRFSSVVQEYEKFFNDIKNKMLLGFYIEYSSALKAPKGHDYSNTQMLKRIGNYTLIYPYIGEFIVYINSFDYVITLNGSLEKKAFFERFYENSYYTEAFWQHELEKDFMYKSYPVKTFILNDVLNQSKPRPLMPIVMKHTKNTDFIIIVLIDIRGFSNNLDADFIKDFFIFDESGTRAFPEEASSDEQFELYLRDISYDNNSPKYIKVENGYLFTYKSSQSALTYCKFYPDTIIRNQINQANRVMTITILAAMLISILLSLYIVKKFNNPVKHMYQLIKRSNDSTDTGKDIIDLRNIKDRIAGIVDQNTNYAKDINEKDSLLKNYFWQTRLKNIILKPHESESNQVQYPYYSVILFKIYFRSSYYANIPKEINEGAYVLKDLIHIYVYEQFVDAVTFQMDEKQIVSIVGVKKEITSIEEPVDKIVKKLMNEDEYVYFTVAYSDVYYSSSELHEVYDKVLNTIKYRKLKEKTQVLSEKILNKKLAGFYFSKEQRERFTNLLENGKKDESLQLINDAFDYNLKKEINELYIYLFLAEVMDSCSNVLLHLYNEIPANLTLTNDYYNQAQCETIQDYKKKYELVISECIDYILKNQKDTDHIVDYVKNYINENYAKDISVDLLADKLKISRTYLSRYFKNSTGINLSDYINTFRMKKACTLLQNSLLMVKDIAPQVGICNIGTFVRLFKSYTGKTPNDYRKSLINSNKRNP